MKRIAKVVMFSLYILGLVYFPYLLAMKVAKNKDKMLKKYTAYYRLMCDWDEVPSEAIEKYFQENNIKTIGIYGVKDMGKKLYQQMQCSKVEVKFWVDRDSGINSYSKLKFYSPDDVFEKVDAIVVTPYFEFDSIANQLGIRNDVKFISIEEVVYGSKG